MLLPVGLLHVTDPYAHSEKVQNQKLFMEISSSGAYKFGISKFEGNECADPRSERYTWEKRRFVSSESCLAENKVREHECTNISIFL